MSRPSSKTAHNGGSVGGGGSTTPPPQPQIAQSHGGGPWPRGRSASTLSWGSTCSVQGEGKERTFVAGVFMQNDECTVCSTPGEDVSLLLLSGCYFTDLQVEPKGQKGSRQHSRHQGSRVQDRDQRRTLELSLSAGLCCFLPRQGTSETGGSSWPRVSHTCPHKGPWSRPPQTPNEAPSGQD